MHPDPALRAEPTLRDVAYARDRGFGLLTAAPEGRPLAAHVPFLLSTDGDAAETHLPRSSPLARACDRPLPALLAVTGPDGYVSPDWYGVDDQVPAWNHVAVHLHGRLEPLPEARIRDHLDRLFGHFEAALAPKVPWHGGMTTEAALARLMGAIRPFRLDVAGIEGTWTLDQARPGPARRSAAGHVAGSHIGQETRLLAALMRGAGQPDAPDTTDRPDDAPLEDDDPCNSTTPPPRPSSAR